MKMKILIETVLKLAADSQEFVDSDDDLSLLVAESIFEPLQELQEDDLELVTAARKVQRVNPDKNHKK